MSKGKDQSTKNLMTKFLDIIEKSGNKLPDPLVIFAVLTFFIVLLSFVLSALGVSVQHPSDGRIIQVENLLSTSNIRRMLVDLVKNFTSFPPLGLVLVVMIGIGVAEKSGLIGTALKRLVTMVPKSFLPATLVFAGVMSSMAADAGYVVLTPLGAFLFAGFGRHPLAGLAAAFAGVSGGFSAHLLLTSLDPLLSGLSTSAAQILEPSYVVQASSNYYFMIVSTFFITLVGSLVTTKIIEPRLGPWKGNVKEDKDFGKVSPQEKKALWATLGVFLLYLLFLCALILPENAVLRDPENGLRPFYESLVALLMILFFVVGVTYGWVAKTIRSLQDIVNMTTETMSTMGAYIVLAFIAAQFIAYFSWSNIGLVTAVSGASALKNIGFSGIPLVFSFIFVTAVLNIFIGSASAKWAIMAPVFIPMMMLMGYSPELVQASYRVGDSVTNIISPLLPYFPIIFAFAKKYDPSMGIGTLISIMVPYSIAFSIFWTILLIIWITFGIPLGPDAPLYFTH